jgi:hypothetical protein
MRTIFKLHSKYPLALLNTYIYQTNPPITLLTSTLVDASLTVKFAIYANVEVKLHFSLFAGFIAAFSFEVKPVVQRGFPTEDSGLILY